MSTPLPCGRETRFDSAAAAGGEADPRLKRAMNMWKNGKTTDEVAEQVLRNDLIRCHRFVSKDYAEIARREPTKAADYLLHLRKTGRIEITLFNKSPGEIGCKIVDLDSGKGEDGRTVLHSNWNAVQCLFRSVRGAQHGGPRWLGWRRGS